jgi:hypothetical protein
VSSIPLGNNMSCHDVQSVLIHEETMVMKDRESLTTKVLNILTGIGK